MPRYKSTERNGLNLPVVLSEQIPPGSFEFALGHLVGRTLDLSDLGARFNNDESGALAYHPRAMLKIVLLADSRGLIGRCTARRTTSRSWLGGRLRQLRTRQQGSLRLISL